jgi:hypothetical protein
MKAQQRLASMVARYIQTGDRIAYEPDMREIVKALV